MKRLALTLLCMSNLFGWSFFFSDEEVPPAPTRPVSFTVMIDPAGDAKDPGRVIDDTYERSLTMQFAEELKKRLEKDNKGLRVILTRFPGEALEPLQHVSFANRLTVDLYISISMAETSGLSPVWYVYQLIHDPATDFIEKKNSGLALLPYDQAYKVALNSSKQYSEKLHAACAKKKIACHPPISLPYKPLMGIMAPSIGLELGIQKKHQWKQLVPAVAEALQESIYS